MSEIEITPKSIWQRLKPRSLIVVEKQVGETVIFRNARGKRYGLTETEFRARFMPIQEER